MSHQTQLDINLDSDDEVGYRSPDIFAHESDDDDIDFRLPESKRVKPQRNLLQSFDHVEERENTEPSLDLANTVPAWLQKPPYSIECGPSRSGQSYSPALTPTSRPWSQCDPNYSCGSRSGSSSATPLSEHTPNSAHSSSLSDFSGASDNHKYAL